MAGKPAYIALDLVRTAVSIVGGQFDAANYPIANLANGRLGKGTRLPYSGTNIDIAITNSPYLQFDTVFVGAHSLLSDSIFYVYGGVTTLSGGPIGFGVWRSRNMWVDIGLQTVFDFIELQFANLSGTVGVPIDLGEVVIGKRIEFPRAPFAPTGGGVERTFPTTGLTVRTLGGSKYRYGLSRSQIIQPTFRFPESERQAFQDFSEAVEAIPFLYIPDVTGVEAYYVTKDFGFNPHTIGRWMDGASLAHWYDWSPAFETESEGILVP